MPLYDFHCPTCDKSVEMLVSYSFVPECPFCHSTGMTRVVSRPSPPGKSKGIIKAARAQAAREGHLSNFD